MGDEGSIGVTSAGSGAGASDRAARPSGGDVRIGSARSAVGDGGSFSAARHDSGDTGSIEPGDAGSASPGAVLVSSSGAGGLSDRVVGTGDVFMGSASSSSTRSGDTGSIGAGPSAGRGGGASGGARAARGGEGGGSGSRGDAQQATGGEAFFRSDAAEGDTRGDASTDGGSGRGKFGNGIELDDDESPPDALSSSCAARLGSSASACCSCASMSRRRAGSSTGPPDTASTTSNVSTATGAAFASAVFLVDTRAPTTDSDRDVRADVICFRSPGRSGRLSDKVVASPGWRSCTLSDASTASSSSASASGRSTGRRVRASTTSNSSWATPPASVSQRAATMVRLRRAKKRAISPRMPGRSATTTRTAVRPWAFTSA
mmetsp:Transcript_1675/g.5042  ORF Transcript_1675/g.5042 Transcript_1675/m.5042 type:complete len:375 (+) Transcript_1675:157-1281(+)